MHWSGLGIAIAEWDHLLRGLPEQPRPQFLSSVVRRFAHMSERAWWERSVAYICQTALEKLWFERWDL